MTSLDDGWVLAVEPEFSIQAPEIRDLADQLVRAEQALESAAVPETVEPEESATMVVDLPEPTMAAVARADDRDIEAPVPVRREPVRRVRARSIERFSGHRGRTAFLGAALAAAAVLFGAFALQSNDTAATTRATAGVGAGVASRGPAIAGIRSSQAEPATRATESAIAPVAVAAAPIAAEPDDAPPVVEDAPVAAAEVAPDVAPAAVAGGTVEPAAPAEPVIGFAQRMERALDARESGRLSVALTQVDAALRLQPRSARALELSADILLQMGQLPRARAAAIKATRVGGHVEAWFTRGLVHYREGDLDQARTSLERYVELGGRSKAAIALLELIRRRQAEPAAPAEQSAPPATGPVSAV